MTRPDYEDHDDHQPMHRKQLPWKRTLTAQAVLCLALYAALNLAAHLDAGDFLSGSRDLYFLSVRGGSRPVKEQTQLLEKVDDVVRARRVEFVICISEYGEKDPLLGNATLHFPSLRSIPWYATGVSRGSGAARLEEQFMVHHGEILDLVGIDTGLWQNFTDHEQVNGSKSNQSSWLMERLAVSSNAWRIVIGYHHPVDCKHGIEQRPKPYDQLHRIFLKHRVNAYLSKGGCVGYFIEHDGISYIGNPGASDENGISLADENPSITRETHEGFFLHRVTPFEIETYLINADGAVIAQHIMAQQERQSM